MNGKMSREDIKDGARGFAMDYCLNEEYPTGFSGYMAGFLKGYDFRQDEIDLLDEVTDIAAGEINSLTDQLKQLESQLLAQKTLNEVTVEYLDEKLKKAEELLSFYANGGNPSWDVSEIRDLGYFTGKRARQYFSGKDGKDT
jgi:hypothetical protein